MAFGDNFEGSVRHILDITHDFKTGGLPSGEISEIHSLHPPAE